MIIDLKIVILLDIINKLQYKDILIILLILMNKDNNNIQY